MAQPTAARKQKQKKEPETKTHLCHPLSDSFPNKPNLLRVCATWIHHPWIPWWRGYSVIESASKDSTSEHLRLLGNKLDLNHNTGAKPWWRGKEGCGAMWGWGLHNCLQTTCARLGACWFLLLVIHTFLSVWNSGRKEGQSHPCTWVLEATAWRGETHRVCTGATPHSIWAPLTMAKWVFLRNWG